MLIATTGWGQENGDVRATLAEGFDAHLTKPVDIGQLRKLIAEHGVRPRNRV